MFHSVVVCVLLIVPALTFTDVERKITQHRINFAGNIDNRVPIRTVRTGTNKKVKTKNVYGCQGPYLIPSQGATSHERRCNVMTLH